MTAVGDQVIRLLELGDIFTWVSDQDRRDALNALKTDTVIDGTIAYLQRHRHLGTLLSRYNGQTPSLFNLTMTLAARVTSASASTIEAHLRQYAYISTESMKLTRYIGSPSNIFGLANDLSRNIASFGITRRGAICAASSNTSSSTASFSGSGATGRDIFAQRVPAIHQLRLAVEQATHSGPNPAGAGPISRRYSNPLIALTVPAAASAREAQAARITCLPISSLFSSVYINGIPSRAAVIAAAARAHRLTPEIVGAIILAEQRDQSRNEDMLDLTAATHRVRRRTTSIGLGQVRDDTAIRADLFQDLLDYVHRTGLSASQTAALLSCDEFNIFACARYIRQVANLAVVHNATTLPDTVAAYPGIDFAAYGRDGSAWPSDNVAALGSEYTSRPWDDRVTGWGDFVRQAWNNMNSAGISW